MIINIVQKQILSQAIINAFFKYLQLNVMLSFLKFTIENRAYNKNLKNLRINLSNLKH